MVGIKIMKKLISLLMLLTAVSSAFARLGDTPEQLKERLKNHTVLSTETMNGLTQMLFVDNQHGYAIALFRHGKSVTERSTAAGYITQEEQKDMVAALANKYDSGAHWSPSNDPAFSYAIMDSRLLIIIGWVTPKDTDLPELAPKGLSWLEVTDFHTPNPEVTPSMYEASAKVPPDDATIKAELVGSWKGPDNQPIVLKANGVFDNHCRECTQTQRWDVHNGVFRTWFGNTSYGGPDSTGNNEFKILSLSKTKFVIQDMYHGRHTGIWTRR